MSHGVVKHMLEHYSIVRDMIGHLQGKFSHAKCDWNFSYVIVCLLCSYIFVVFIFRFCDSPTEELDARTPKGRAKRGRNAAQQPANDLSNFTETRSSVSPV